MKEWAELLRAIGEIITASAWPLVCLTLMLFFKEDLKKGCMALFLLLPRLSDAEIAGAKFKLSPPESVLALPKVEQLGGQKLVGERPLVLTKEGRASIYEKNRGVFLTHVFEPTIRDGRYTVQIYLIGHRKYASDVKDASEVNSLGAVKKVSFYLGDMWQDEVFSRTPDDGQPIGITLTAYGPFLCTCVVTFDDDCSIELYRYIDFEMQWVFLSSITFQQSSN